MPTPDLAHGLALLAAGDTVAAEPLLRRAAIAAPADPVPHHALGELLLSTGRAADAIGPLTTAVTIAPATADAWVSLGRATLAAGRLADAAAAFGQALSHGADDPAIDAALAAVFDAMGRPTDALAAHRRLAHRLPNHPAALNNYGQMLVRLGRPGAGVAVLRRAVALDPQLASARVNLASGLRDLGQPTEATAAAAAAVAARPDDARVGSVLLYGLHFDPAATPDRIAAEHARWAERHAPAPTKPASEGTPEGPDFRRTSHAGLRRAKLRLGYVSPDFRSHVVGRFIAPILARHDRSAVEVVCYSDVTAPDAATAALRGSVDRWHDTATLDDAALAAMIAADGIDVLVDLTGHMAGNRLLAFARRPAPVQVSHVSYPASVGLPAIGWRVTDRHLDPTPPPGPERLLYLPDSFYLYDPRDDRTAEPSRSAADSAPATGAVRPRAKEPAAEPLGSVSREVTFGSLSASNKATPAAVDLWAAVLRRVPDARFVVTVPPDGSTVESLSAAFAARGVDPGRITCEPARPFDDYLRLYDGIDVVLDPQPYGGGVTTCDALWRGVAVVTLVGPTSVGRAAASIVRTAGHGDWACDTPAAYAEAAARLALDRPTRSAVAASLLASPVCDAERYTRHLEALFRSTLP